MKVDGLRDRPLMRTISLAGWQAGLWDLVACIPPAGLGGVEGRMPG